MFFDMLDVRNFGPLPKLNVKFNPTGINVISGPNESGKTQLVGSIIFALFGEKCIQYRHVNDNTSEVKLVIKEGEISQTLNYNTIIKSNQSKVGKPEINKSISYNPPTSDEIALHSNLIEWFLETNKPKLLFNNIECPKYLDVKRFNIINESIKNDSDIYNMWINILNPLINIVDRKDPFSKLSFLSEGQNSIVKFANEYINRKKNIVSIPLIIDDAFVSLDETGFKLACKLLSAIAQKDQVIILTSKPDRLLRILQNDVKKHIQLKKYESSHISSIYYRYDFIELLLYPHKHTPKLLQGGLKQKFILNKPIDIEENLYHEFKEIKGNNVTSSIKNVADIYVVAFLNSKIKTKGSIFWGIRDKDSTVVGVKLNLSERDNIRRVVTEKLHQIQPAIAPTEYKIDMHQVYALNNKVPNLYIIEIAVPPTSSDYLYTTGSGEIYVKTDAGKKKLTGLEIQKEILNRKNS